MISRRQFFVAFAALLFFSGAAPGRAAAQANAGVFIQNLGDTAIRTLTSQKLTDRQREDEFRRLFLDNFDVPRISRFVLGRFWRQATPAQRAEYQKLFADYIVMTYSINLAHYNKETIHVSGTHPEAGDTIVMSTIAQPDGHPINVNWRVRGAPGHYRITDVVVDGVSMAITQRQEFASVIEGSGGNVATLITQLREKVQQLSQ